MGPPLRLRQHPCISRSLRRGFSSGSSCSQALATLSQNEDSMLVILVSTGLRWCSQLVTLDGGTLRWAKGVRHLAFPSTKTKMATMPMVSGKGDVRWSLFRDAACSEAARMLVGSFAAERLLAARSGDQQSAQESGNSTLNFGGVQLVSEIERHTRRLLSQQQEPTRAGGDGGFVHSDVFPVAAEDLTLGPTEAPKTVYCKLEVEFHESADTEMETVSAVTDASEVETGWFGWKLARAKDYRARGSEAFKVGRVRAAIALYKRSLAWLEAPTSSPTATCPDVAVTLDPAELALVTPVAVACHANLAACYAKLEGADHVELSLASASRALELDATHVKARFRRSQAYMVAKEYDAALADLAQLRELEPRSALFRSALSRAQTAKAHWRKQQQSKFATLFK